MTDTAIILAKLESVCKRLDAIEKDIGDIKKSCSGMDSHIVTIESVYQKLKAPINWAVSIFSGQTVPDTLNDEYETTNSPKLLCQYICEQ